MSETFEDLVLRWLQKKAPGATKVVSVEGSGSDWAGSTESGFYERFDVSISYETADQHAHWLDVEGNDMEDLWNWIVNEGFKVASR